MTHFAPDLILCDLDGTMVDSVPDLARGVDDMMASLGMPVRGVDKVREWVGNGVERLVKRALLNHLKGEPDEALYEKALPLFKQAYAKYNGQGSIPFPGVIDGLDWLKAQGFKLGCITNKPGQFTLPLLKSLKLDTYFSLTISGDSLPKKKPDPMPLLYGAEYFKVPSSKALMLGDSISDVRAARAAQFQIICVSYGYNHGEDIRTAQPDAVIDSLTELSALLVKPGS
jgi:phosphoglycolate phosphatase